MNRVPKLRHSRWGGPDREHLRIRRRLLELVLEILARDHRSAADVAHMFGTSRSRAHGLLHGAIDKFNSESLIDMLFRLGVVVDIHVTERRRYRRWEFSSSRARGRFIEPWRQ